MTLSPKRGINGDGSAIAQKYIEPLKLQDFQSIEDFISTLTAREMHLLK